MISDQKNNTFQNSLQEKQNRLYNWETINKAHWEVGKLVIGKNQNEYFSFLFPDCYAVIMETIMFIYTRRKQIEHSKNLRFSDQPENWGQYRQQL